MLVKNTEIRLRHTMHPLETQSLSGKHQETGLQYIQYCKEVTNYFEKASVHPEQGKKEKFN